MGRHGDLVCKNALCVSKSTWVRVISSQVKKAQVWLCTPRPPALGVCWGDRVYWGLEATFLVKKCSRFSGTHCLKEIRQRAIKKNNRCPPLASTHRDTHMNRYVYTAGRHIHMRTRKGCYDEREVESTPNGTAGDLQPTGSVKEYVILLKELWLNKKQGVG